MGHTANPDAGAASQEQPVASNRQAADIIVSYLEQLEVDFVFGIPGGAIEPLFNALARSERRGSVRPIVARHETGAAFMADGYARHTGKLAVCCATTGPGTTNLITGVASAYENNIPMLVITAQTPLSTLGRGAFQESSCTGVNTVGMFQYCTRYNTFVSHIEQLEHKLCAAILSAFNSPMGPSHISIPLDVMRAPLPQEQPPFRLDELVNRPAIIDEVTCHRFCDEASLAKNAVFVIGDGCSDAIGAIVEAALRLDAKIVTTPHGKGLISPYHPLFRGVIGFAGHRSAYETVNAADVDLVVAIGTSLGEWASNGWDEKLLNRDRLVHVESTESNLTRSPMARLHVRGQIRRIFERLNSELEARGTTLNTALDCNPLTGDANSASYRRHFILNEEHACTDESVPIKPQRLMTDLVRLFPPNTRWLADTGASFAWAIHYLHPFDRRMMGQREGNTFVFRASLEFSSMGWAIGACVGTALAANGAPVVCITGDGSMLMSGQEITVALQEQLPVIFVVLNDAALGMVKHGQRLGGAEQVGHEIPPVDFRAFAQAMGVDAYTIQSPADLAALDIKQICARSGPTLLDVHIDPESIPPIATRMRVLGAVK